MIGGTFTGSAQDFVAAGDSVLVRIKHHMNEGMHLFVAWSRIAVFFCLFFSSGVFLNIHTHTVNSEDFFDSETILIL